MFHDFEFLKKFYGGSIFDGICHNEIAIILIQDLYDVLVASAGYHWKTSCLICMYFLVSTTCCCIIYTLLCFKLLSMDVSALFLQSSSSLICVDPALHAFFVDSDDLSRLLLT
jgi:hypothetical protein